MIEKSLNELMELGNIYAPYEPEYVVYNKLIYYIKSSLYNKFVNKKLSIVENIDNLANLEYDVITSYDIKFTMNDLDMARRYILSLNNDNLYSTEISRILRQRRKETVNKIVPEDSKTRKYNLIAEKLYDAILLLEVK